MTTTNQTIVHITCDNCGTTQIGETFLGWWRIDQHPKGIDFAPFNQPRPPFDLCSWACVYSWADRHRR